MYTKGKCTKSHNECPRIRNPTCQWHKAGGCRDGAKCLFPHRETGGVLAVQQAPSKKFIKAEEKKAQEAAKNDGKAKAKAKPKGKAKAKSDK